MKVTTDTNVLVSAIFWKGASNIILEKAEKKEIELILSMKIIEELTRVLSYKEIQDKIKNKNLEMQWTIEKILFISTIVEPIEKLNIVKEDIADNKILECAKTGNVDYIISNDNHLLKLEKFENIKIVSPKEFLAKF